MSTDPTNRQLLKRWQQGDEVAAQILVDRYLARLTALARSRLSRRLARRLDPEDVVLSAWRSFFVATERGRIDIPDDDNLWPVLVTLTLRKLSRQTARHQAQRRDIKQEQSFDAESAWMVAVANDPRPEEAIVIVDELQYLLSKMGPSDRKIVSHRLQGNDTDDVAKLAGCSDRTVRRAMQRFRDAVEKRNHEDSENPLSAMPLPAGRFESAVEESYDRPTPSYELVDLVLQEMIGQGGFGKVYRAFDRQSRQTVAVKFLRKRLWKHERATQALIRETQLLSRIAHAAIIRHRGWGQTPAGGVFVVMDWIDGGDLSRALTYQTSNVVAATRLARQVADGLCASHAAGIVHGDLTPANVLLRNDASAVLTDFGFATSLGQGSSHPRGGTPGFLAPEQVCDAFGPITVQTDIYGIGGLLYAMFTGEPPFVGIDRPDTLALVLSSRAPQPIAERCHSISVPLAKLIDQCLLKDPAARPATMQEVRQRLAEPT